MAVRSEPLRDERTPLSPQAQQPWSQATEKKIVGWFDVVAAIFGALIVGSLWYIGGVTTIYSFTTMFSSIATWGLAAWLIPIAFSVVEVVYSIVGRAVPIWGKVVFLLVGFFDLASTFYGLFQWLPGRYISLLTGFTIPENGPVLFTVISLISLVLTFAPERIFIGLFKSFVMSVRIAFGGGK